MVNELEIQSFCRMVKNEFVRTKAAHSMCGYNGLLHRCVALSPQFFYQLGYKLSKYSEFLTAYQPWQADRGPGAAQRSPWMINGVESESFCW